MLPPAPIEFSAELSALAGRFRERPVSLGDVLDTLGPRASALLILICALPFATPISLPGLSTPFGLVILLLAGRYFLALPPWLPGRLRRVVLPPAFFSKVLTASARLMGWLERRLAARLPALVDADWKLRLHSTVVILAALLLMVPLPPLPPFTNTLPALVAVVMTLATMKRDGAGIVAAYALFGFTLAYFAFWGALVVETFERYGARLLALLGGSG